MSTTAQQILESIPQRFRAEKAQGYNAIFHFDVYGEEALQYTVTIKDGNCTLEKGLAGEPDCIVGAKASTYIDLETGKANPQMVFMAGQIKVTNIAAMMQFARCFRKWTVDAEQQAIEGAKLSSMTRPEKKGPLAGIKVLDFTRLLPGPLATMFLADMGADVIKIEDPDRPDYIRDFQPIVNGVSTLYLALNRNKRSLAVNYLSPAGKQLIYDLVKSADVLVEQFRPGVMQGMGFGYDELHKLNPKLVYVSITGYGQNSSMAMAAGHDLNYIGIAGALGITGIENGGPVIPGFQLADIAGGSYMAMNAVTTALYQRERTGQGDWVDVSMTDAVVPFTVLQFANYQGNKQNIGRGEYELSGGLANYNIYQCADGKYVALGSLEPKFWNKFCESVGRMDWTKNFLKQGEELQKLKEEVRRLFLTKTRGEWIKSMKTADVCLTPVNDLDELEHDKYLLERQMFLENEHPAVGKYKTINQPLKFKQAKFDNNWSAPTLGEDSASVLREIAYTDERISALKQQGVVKL